MQSTSAANFQVFYLDHSTSSSVKSLSIDNVSGQWSYVQSSTANMSCIVVKSSTLFLALRLDTEAGTFVTHSSISLSNIPTAVLSTAFTVGENCELLLSGSSIYSISSSGLNFIRLFSGIKAYSSSLKFIVDGSSLFGYTGSNFVSTPLATYTQYSIINNYQNYLVVSGSRSTGTTTFSVQQTIFFAIFSNNNFNIFNSINITATSNPTNTVPVMVSPQMTKIHYQYYSGTTLNVIFKELDFD